MRQRPKNIKKNDWDNVESPSLSDDILARMEPVHKKFVQTFFPWLHKKVFLLGAWPGKQTRKSAIKDPMGGSYEKYQGVFNLIKTHIERIFPLL